MAKIDISELSFEQSLSELENIVRTLESGAAELDAAMQLYARGVALKQHCESILATAKLKIEEIISKDGNAIGTTESPLAQESL